MKMKYILPILCLLFTFVSCQEDNTPPPPNPNPNYTEVGPSMEFVHPGILHTTASIITHVDLTQCAGISIQYLNRLLSMRFIFGDIPHKSIQIGSFVGISSCQCR